MYAFLTRDSKSSFFSIFFLPKFLQPAPHSSYSQQSLMLFSIAALTNQCKLRGWNNSSFLFYTSMGQKWNSGSVSQNQGVAGLSTALGSRREPVSLLVQEAGEFSSLQSENWGPGFLPASLSLCCFPLLKASSTGSHASNPCCLFWHFFVASLPT